MGRIARSPSQHRRTALEVFTDRTGLIEEFDEILASKQRDENNVLVFYGDGGIGKSTLSWKLQERLVSLHHGHLFARLDFADFGNTERRP